MAAEETVELCSWAEMEEKAHVEVRCSKAAEDLVLVSRTEPIGGFGLDQEDFVDDHVDSMPSEDMTLVIDWNPYFSGDSMSSFDQFTFQGLDVDLLEKAKAEGVVNLEEGPNG